MIRVAYIISFVHKSIAFEWIAASLDSSRFELHFILLNDRNTPLEDHLRAQEIAVHRIAYSGKKQLPAAILKTRRYLKRNRIDVVHAHLFDASLVGLIAAKLAGVRKRIHTRHNAMIHHDFHPQAVKYDRLINRLSTEIVAISENVREILVELEGVDPQKVTDINHGFRISDFEHIDTARIEAIARKHNIDRQKTVIGVISRYIEWKGVQYVIPAFQEFLKHQPDSLLVLANADGPYKAEIRESLADLPAKSYVEIPFEEDVFALYRIFDIFVHVPIDARSEAFGQTYIETMLSGLPSVVTRSGIASEIVEDRKNALVVPYKDSKAITRALNELKNDADLYDLIRKNGYKTVKKRFSLENMIQKLEDLYKI